MPQSKIVICTLFEGTHHFGLAAFLNSLLASGFQGTVVAGHKGPLPPWAPQLTPLPGLSADSESTFQFGTGCTVVFRELNTDWHLTNYKPVFLQLIWETRAANATHLAYFDPDIFIRCKWTYFEHWLSCADLCLCREPDGQQMSDDHPIRHSWYSYAARQALSKVRSSDRYFNGGFIGVSRAGDIFLTVWRKLQEHMPDEGVALSSFGTGDRSHPFHITDQDTLNLAVSLTDLSLSTMGPAGMDFTYGGFCMSHAIGKPKPWSKSFVRSALSGTPPSLADRAYLRFSTGPIRAHGPLWNLITRHIDYPVARLLSRLLA